MVAPQFDPLSESSESSEPSKKISPKKCRANRQNATLSTGPRTVDGKARAALNAMTHGIFARVVLEGEDAQHFAGLQHDYIVQLNPQDRLELDLVNRIDLAQWRLSRCDDAEGLYLDSVGQRSKKVALEELDKVKAEYGIEDIHEDLITDDDRDRALLSRLRRLEKSADYRFLACANLAAAMIEPNNAVERMSRYQQRLEQTIHRCLAELEKLRGTARSKWADLPPGPYLRPMGDLVVEALERRGGGRGSDENDQSECNQTQPGAAEEPIVQNEPTAEEPAASEGPGEACAKGAEEITPDPALLSDPAFFSQVLNVREDPRDEG